MTTKKNHILLACLSVLLVQISCTQAPKPSANSSSSNAKRYHLKGKVVSIDKSASSVNIDAEAIPDFMGAMTMPYKLKPESELEKLKPGDPVTADVVVQDENYWLENVVVPQNAPAAPK